jgi:DNA-binding CsgD family transcriptional regulator
VSAVLDAGPDAHVVPDGLSPREVKALRLLAISKSHREIADSLCTSLNTVAALVCNILSQTMAANRAEAAAYALRQGLVKELESSRPRRSFSVVLNQPRPSSGPPQTSCIIVDEASLPSEHWVSPAEEFLYRISGGGNSGRIDRGKSGL